MLDESNHKPNKKLVDKGSQLLMGSMKSWLKKNDIEMYSTNNKGESVIAERFIKTLKKKINKYIASISENVYIDKLDDIVNKLNNIYDRTLKMMPINVKSSIYIDFDRENNNGGTKLVIMLEHQNIKNVLAIDYTQIGLKKLS